MKKRKNTVAQISKRAKQIRKKGEQWTDAIKRASKELKSKNSTLGKTGKKILHYRRISWFKRSE